MNYYHGHRDELVFKGEQANFFISLFDDNETVQKVAKCIFADGLTNKQTAEKGRLFRKTNRAFETADYPSGSQKAYG